MVFKVHEMHGNQEEILFYQRLAVRLHPMRST